MSGGLMGEDREEEEERLSRMVSEFLESETAPHGSSPASQSHRLPQDDTFLSLKRIINCAIEEEKGVYESVMKHLRQSGSEGRHSLNKELMLRMRMEGYDASLCRSSWVSSIDCPEGAYECVDMMLVDAKGQTERLIVDIDFKSQFEIARPTADYIQLCNILPSVFVGTEEKLNKIILLICNAAKKSLTESGLHIPPWRKASYMQSKWSSLCQREITVSFSIFSRDKSDSPVANINNWTPKNLMPRKRQLGFQQSGLSKEFASFRCPTAA